jgi:thiol-disulfide isomerase/thioredoxin
VYKHLKLLILGLGLLATLDPARAEDYKVQTAPAVTAESADAILKSASVRATASGKNILILFRASWCPWCRRLESVLLNDPNLGKLLASNYEIVRLNVREKPDKKMLENPGSGLVLFNWGGAGSGVPYIVIADPKLKKLTDSNRLPQQKNIGYPESSEDIAAFGDMLKTTAPNLTGAELAQISTHLKQNAPKQ